MEYQYLSPAWAQEALRRLQQDLTPERMKYVTSSMITIYNRCPDGHDRAVYYRLVHGVVVELSLHTEQWPDAEFSITGDYEVFAQISRAELKARAALMSGRLKLRGNLVKALSLAPLVDRLNQVLATIPASY